MSTNKSKPKYTARVPWVPTTRHRLVPHGSSTDKLYVYRDDDGDTWWSDGCAVFRGSAPAYLRAAYLSAPRPVDAAVTMVPPVFARARLTPGTRLGLPVASYQMRSACMTRPVAVDVFAAAGQDPEIHVDARYLAYARERFAGCSFWRALHDAFVTVRDQRTPAIVGVIPPRRPPRQPRARRSA